MIEIPNFEYLQDTKYSCGKIVKIVSEYKHLKTGMKFSLIGGEVTYKEDVITLSGHTFLMGNIQKGFEKTDVPLHGGQERDMEEPAHIVTILPFLVSQTVVTQSVWKNIMQTEPWKNETSFIQEGSEYPATCISWSEATEFCKRVDLQLLSESQWEYACRGGCTERYYWGHRHSNISDYAWCDGYLQEGIERVFVQKVAQKKPNAYGLYDMSGNVGEWCEDHMYFNYEGAPIDDSAWYDDELESGRVVRGGDCYYSSWHCRSSSRQCGSEDGGPLVGFRLSTKRLNELLSENGNYNLVTMPAKPMSKVKPWWKFW